MIIKVSRTIYCSGDVEVTRVKHGEFVIHAKHTKQYVHNGTQTKCTLDATVTLSKQSAHDVLVALLEFFPQMKAECRKKVRDEIKRRADRRKALIAENDAP